MDLNTQNDQGQESQSQSQSQSQSSLDEFKDFMVELWDMIKKDFRNSINFISSNRSFFTTTVLLAILLQVSSISNLGASFEKYCGGREMRGGGGEPGIFGFQELQAAEAQDKVDKKADVAKAKKEAKIQKKIDKKLDKKVDKLIKSEAAAIAKGELNSHSTQNSLEATVKKQITDKAKAKDDASALKQGKSASISQYKANKADMREQDKLMKANKERLSFFEGIKKKFQSTLSPGALGGPLFGKLDLIFDSVKDVFYIVAILLTIAGVLSLPVLVFLIITYYVFKTMISKFIIL